MYICRTRGASSGCRRTRPQCRPRQRPRWQLGQSWNTYTAASGFAPDVGSAVAAALGAAASTKHRRVIRILKNKDSAAEEKTCSPCWCRAEHIMFHLLEQRGNSCGSFCKQSLQSFSTVSISD